MMWIDLHCLTCEHTDQPLRTITRVEFLGLARD